MARPSRRGHGQPTNELSTSSGIIWEENGGVFVSALELKVEATSNELTKTLWKCGENLAVSTLLAKVTCTCE